MDGGDQQNMDQSASSVMRSPTRATHRTT